MKIGYDAKRAFENQTGLGNYSRDLINNGWKLIDVHPKNKNLKLFKKNI